jgi:transcriptional regulator with XRE-family HTH domain
MNQEQQQIQKEQGPLVFYLELLRENHGERGLRQEQLAALIGISPSQLRRYEQMRQLPKVIEHLVAAAYVLGVRTLEALIAPGLLEEVYSRVDERLEAKGLPRRRSGPGGHDDGRQ